MVRLRQLAGSLEDLQRAPTDTLEAWNATDAQIRRIHAAGLAKAKAAGDSRTAFIIGIRSRHWAEAHAEAVERLKPPTDRERQLISLKLASPMRPSSSQADAGHLPLFVAANEPTLF